MIIRNTPRLEKSDGKRTAEVQTEIDTYLQAINSYPDRFAREPYISFQEHLLALAHLQRQRSLDQIGR